jgi:hypothetical protein
VVPEPSVSEIELAIEKLKSHKSQGIDEIPAKMINAGGLGQLAVRFINFYFYSE